MRSPTGAIDMATFTELQEAAGADFVVELVQTFFEEAPQLMQDLQAALQRGDAAGFRRAAHSLKSNGNTFGALSFSAQARELELGDMAALGERGQVLLNELQQEYERAALALKELTHA